MQRGVDGAEKPVSAAGSRARANAVARALFTGVLNVKRHALADALGRAITFFLTAEQILDAIGERALWVFGRFSPLVYIDVYIMPF